MRKSKVKHLFFDLDNTILDFSFASKIAFRNTLDYFSRYDSQAYQIYNVRNASVWEEFEKGQIDAIELRKKRFQVFLDQMGWEGDGKEWNKVYLDNVVENNKYVTGALDLVIRLSKNFKIDIVTNGLREVQRPRLHRTDLLPHLNSITVSDEIGYAKPNADFFKIAMKNAVTERKDEILMIGDSYRSDIRGGANFGLKTCWFNPEKKEVDSNVHDFEIHDLSYLESILDDIS